MSVLYIAGTEHGAGATALAAATARHLAAQGRSVSLVKPLRLVDEGSPPGPDPDVEFYAKAASATGPAAGPMEATAAQLAQDPGLVRSAAETVAGLAGDGRSVIVEGLAVDTDTADASAALAGALNARVIVASTYQPSMTGQELRQAADQFGESLAGVVLNRVYRHRAHDATARLGPAIEAEGVRLLGAVPEDRRMLAPSVRDLAEHLDGEFLLFPERGGDLVEYVMTGGWFLDQGVHVFSRRDNKAVVVRGDRPDLQMAALETSTVCLVLTGGITPIQYVTYHAEQEEVPLIQTPHSTLETLQRLHTVDQRVSVRHAEKVARYADLMAQHCRMDEVLGAVDGR